MTCEEFEVVTEEDLNDHYIKERDAPTATSASPTQLLLVPCWSGVDVRFFLASLPDGHPELKRIPFRPGRRLYLFSPRDQRRIRYDLDLHHTPMRRYQQLPPHFHYHEQENTRLTTLISPIKPLFKYTPDNSVGAETIRHSVVYLSYPG